MITESSGDSRRAILTADELASLMSDVKASSEAEPAKESPSPSYSRIANIASLIGGFDPSRLFPDATESDLRQLLRDCTVATEGTASRWLLKAGARRHWLLPRLKNLTSLLSEMDTVRKRLAESGAPYDRLMNTFRNVITGKLLDPSALSRDALADYRTVLGWLPDGVSGLPVDAGEALRRIEIEEILEPFRFLTGYEPTTGEDLFVGREAELRRLRSFVDVLDSRSMGERLTRSSARLFRSSSRTLIVSGIGGIGKSTLIAKFVLQHRSTNDASLPFAYLDLDRSTLTAAQPATLLLEIARQLGWQYPEQQTPLQHLRERVRQSMAEQREVLRPDYWRDQHIPLLDDRALRRYMSELVSIVRDSVVDTPVLLVIDTFEEAQAMGQEAVAQMENFENVARETFDNLRMVIVGRDSAEGLFNGAQRLTLEEFADQESRRAFLVRRGVEREDARVIAREVNGRPLALMLAARLALEFGLEATKVSLIDSFRAKFRQRLIEGILYERILEHIGDATVRLLVHPGLVLRCIDEEVIRKVIIPVRGLPPLDDEQIGRALDALRNQRDLIRIDETGSIWHRPDVRAQMLELMTTERPEEVRALHAAAVEYYVERQAQGLGETFLRDRIEELYHRLAGGYELDAVAERWIPAAHIELASCVGELQDATGRVTLKAMLGSVLMQEEFARLPRSVQVLYVRYSIRQALSRGDLERALMLFTDNERLLPGPFRLEFAPRVFDQAGYVSEAHKRYVEAGLASGISSTDRHKLLELADFYERWPELDSKLAETVLAELLERINAAAWEKLPPVPLIVAATRLERAVIYYNSGARADVMLNERFARQIKGIGEYSLNDRFWLVALTPNNDLDVLGLVAEVPVTDSIRLQLDMLIELAQTMPYLGFDRKEVVWIAEEMRSAPYADVERLSRSSGAGTSTSILFARHIARPATPQWYVPLAHLLLMKCDGALPLKRLAMPFKLTTPFAQLPNAFDTARALAEAFAAFDRLGMLHLALRDLVKADKSLREGPFHECLSHYLRWRHSMLELIDEITDPIFDH
ncbi:ATP-binding protein [Paraburkholderia strydomiana]|uniref:ATP-binding protein n=1 Tax=Paraburkholderia strydomiana TaxID=1245417 RepID=UPI0038BAF9AB